MFLNKFTILTLTLLTAIGLDAEIANRNQMPRKQVRRPQAQQRVQQKPQVVYEDEAIEEQIAPVRTKNQPPREPIFYKDLNTMQEYEQALSCGKPVIIKYSAPWCQACTHMEPAFNAAARKHTHKARFCKINIDKNQFKDLVKKHKIEGLPTTVFLNRQKQEVKRERGAISNTAEFDKAVDAFLKGPQKPYVPAAPAKPTPKNQPKK